MAKASSRQIIDAWAQPVLKDGLLPEVVRLFEQSGSAHLLGQDLSAAQLVEMMDKAGVDRVMLCAWHRPGTWVIRNDTIAEFVRQFPERFVGVAPSIWKSPSRRSANCSVPSGTWGSRHYGWCPGCGIVRPTTSSIFPSTSPVSSWIFLSAPRSVIPAPSCLPNLGVRFPISMRWL